MGLEDGFVAKYSKDGTYRWGLRLGGSGSDIINALATDASADVYVLGEFIGQADLGGKMVTASGGRDGFLLKIRADGSPQWQRAIGGPMNDVAASLCVRPDGSVAVVGDYTGSFTTGFTQTSRGFNDAYLLTVLPEGTFSALRTYGSAASETARRVVCFSDGSLVLGGRTSGSSIPAAA